MTKVLTENSPKFKNAIASLIAERKVKEDHRRKLILKKKQREKLEAAIEELNDYTASCSREPNQAFLLVCKWARKGLRSS